MSVFDDAEDLLSVFKCRIISRVSHYSAHSWESDGKDRDSRMTRTQKEYLDSRLAAVWATDLIWAWSNKTFGSQAKQ